MGGLAIARMRMRNSGLTGEGFGSAEEAVRWHLAMQAQDYGPAKWSVGQRSRGLADADLDEAVATGAIVRTHVLRPTWHLVAREDVRWLLTLSGPRVQQGNAGRYRELGLDARARARAEKLIATALSGGNRLTRNQLAEVLDAAGLDRAGQRMPHILMHCELEGVIGSGGLEGKQQTYALLDGRIPPGRALDRDEALVELARRYLGSHGPATVKDLSWWSGLTIADARRAFDLLGSEVASEGVDGLTLWSLAAGSGRAPTVRGFHLLQIYDELLVGYGESRYAGDPRAGAARAAWGDRRLPNGVILRGGAVAGHWRRTSGSKRIDVEALLYDPPTAADERALARAASALGRFAGLPVVLETGPVRPSTTVLPSSRDLG